MVWKIRTSLTTSQYLQIFVLYLFIYFFVKHKICIILHIAFISYAPSFPVFSFLIFISYLFITHAQTHISNAHTHTHNGTYRCNRTEMHTHTKIKRHNPAYRKMYFTWTNSALTMYLYIYTITPECIFPNYW